MDAIDDLRALGYVVAAEAGVVTLTYVAAGNPDRARVAPLIAALRARKAEVLAALGAEAMATPAAEACACGRRTTGAPWPLWHGRRTCFACHPMGTAAPASGPDGVAARDDGHASPTPHPGTGMPLRYHGGKSRLAGWTLSRLPRDHDAYVEPFFGGGGVFWKKPRSPVEVVNDLDGQVVTFWRVLRDPAKASELARLVWLTPFSRDEVARACEPPPPGTPDVEVARRLVVQSWQTRHGAPATCQLGPRFDKGVPRPGAGSGQNVRTWANVPDRLAWASGRLRDVQLECRDALAVIRAFGGERVLVYADPPYLTETRSPRWRTSGYRHEYGEADHRALAEVLDAHPGMAAVAGYASPLYEELYEARGWRREERRARDQAHGEQLECLWLSPRLVVALDGGGPLSEGPPAADAEADP